MNTALHREIHMSTSAAVAPNLSTLFSANTGPDDTVVFPTQRVTISVRGSTGGPNPFRVLFPLAKPFFYDPRRGSFCIDIFSHGSAQTGLQLDTSNIESLGLGGVIGQPSSELFVTALVAQITFQPVRSRAVRHSPH